MAGEKGGNLPGLDRPVHPVRQDGHPDPVPDQVGHDLPDDPHRLLPRSSWAS
ncbi:MAG: hypothetical protein MZV64_32775 [Ignavibacteriales bacterium]|nr:hypothetical protein [Ignavibacteriales bacterium]